MKVVLRHPRREVQVTGPKRVHALLAELGLVAEAHLVICNDELVPSDALLPDDAVVEVRPVISGGA
jgi:sulfur carrier protein ThiS